MYAATLGSMNYRQGWAALEIEKWQSWSEMTLRGGTASFCQIGIAHGARPKLGQLQLGHGARPKLGHSYRLASETWVKAKAGAHSPQLQFQPG